MNRLFSKSRKTRKPVSFAFWRSSNSKLCVLLEGYQTWLIIPESAKKATKTQPLYHLNRDWPFRDLENNRFKCSYVLSAGKQIRARSSKIGRRKGNVLICTESAEYYHVRKWQGQRSAVAGRGMGEGWEAEKVLRSPVGRKITSGWSTALLSVSTGLMLSFRFPRRRQLRFHILQIRRPHLPC